MPLLQDPPNRIIMAMNELQQQISIRGEMLEAISELVNCKKWNELIELVKTALKSSTQIKELQGKVFNLEGENM